MCMSCFSDHGVVEKIDKPYNSLLHHRPGNVLILNGTAPDDLADGFVPPGEIIAVDAPTFRAVLREGT